MAYLPLNADKPEGANTPPVYADDDLGNVRALRDGIVSGFVPGWALAVTTAVTPTRDIYTWTKGVYRLRATVTYTAGLIALLLWEWSENSGGAYSIISTGGTASALVSSATGIITSADKDATGFLLALSAGQRSGVGGAALTAHAALVGAAAHGLGTLSTQGAGAVAITGGSVAGVAATLLSRLTPAAPPTLTTGQALDWAARPTQVHIAAGATITGQTNAIPGEMKRIVVIGNGAITLNAGGGNTITMGTGHPVWGVNYTIVNLLCVTATTFLATTIPF